MRWCAETYKYRTRALQYSLYSDASWRVKPTNHDDSDTTGTSKVAPKQLATTTYRERCNAITTALLSDSTFESSNLTYDRDPYCSYCFDCLGWCWGETLTDLSALAMIVGGAIFAWGVWDCDSNFDIVVNPQTPGQWFQVVGLLVGTGFFVLLLVVSVAKQKLQKVLYGPLILAFII